MREGFPYHHIIKNKKTTILRETVANHIDIIQWSLTFSHEKVYSTLNY